MSKALNACCRYYHINQEIKRVTREIGEWQCTNPTPKIDLIEQPDIHCIDRHYYHRTLPYDQMCGPCKMKDRLIQYRKQLRQQLGAAKRWISAIGKEEMQRVTKQTTT